MATKVNSSVGFSAVAVALNTALATHEYIYPNTGSIVFDKGTGSSNWNIPKYGINYGEWVIRPFVDFNAEVKMWGAGGGAHGSTGGAAGGGGFARADVTFYKDRPYTVIVGEGGFHGNHVYDGNSNRYNARIGGAFGGGGAASHVGGGGGGFSGLFFDSGPTNGGPGTGHQMNSTSFRGAGQANALLIAGGGGGAGHHGTSAHGQGGGGGGSSAGVAHAQDAPNQNNAGTRWNGHNHGELGRKMHGGYGGNSSYLGGGGGGWYGGSGGTHHSSHHNGGAGGSGHALDQYSTARHPNFWIKSVYPTIVRSSYLEAAPGTHQNHNPAPAATSDVDYTNYVAYGAGNSTTYTPDTQSGNNGRVILRFKG
jgi:hypothetical protein